MTASELSFRLSGDKFIRINFIRKCKDNLVGSFTDIRFGCDLKGLF